MAGIEKSISALDQVQSVVITQAVEFGPKLIVAGIIAVMGYYVGNWVASLLERGLKKFQLDPSLSQLLTKLLRVLVLALFVVVALQNLGVQLLPLIAGLGVAGAGVALAMQGILSNLVAGLVIIFTHPFRVGEYISIVGVEGNVLEISLFNTILGHTDNSRVVIPNRKIVGEILHNYGNVRQVGLSVNVAYDSDLNTVFATIQELLRNNAGVLHEPAPIIQIVALDKSSVSIAVKPWVEVQDYVDVMGQLNRQILEAFRDKGIVIPFPRTDIHLVKA